MWNFCFAFVPQNIKNVFPPQQMIKELLLECFLQKQKAGQNCPAFILKQLNFTIL